jgi:hypothetical protein
MTSALSIASVGRGIQNFESRQTGLIGRSGAERDVVTRSA